MARPSVGSTLLSLEVAPTTLRLVLLIFSFQFIVWLYSTSVIEGADFSPLIICPSYPSLLSTFLGEIGFFEKKESE